MGDEIYFNTGIVVTKEENSKDVVELGDVAYWILGKAISLEEVIVEKIYG